MSEEVLKIFVYSLVAFTFGIIGIILVYFWFGWKVAIVVLLITGEVEFSIKAEINKFL